MYWLLCPRVYVRIDHVSVHIVTSGSGRRAGGVMVSVVVVTVVVVVVMMLLVVVVMLVMVLAGANTKKNILREFSDHSFS
jgi:predicted metalloprotease